MRTITRTIYGARLQSLQYFGLPYNHVPNTTLNEKLNIFPDQRPDNGEMPRNRYFSIGNRGHRMAIGADSFPFTDELQHQPSDAAPFGIMPFVLRRATDDLDVATRSQYGLRRLETHNGQNYIAYYARRIDLTGVVAAMFNNDVENGITTKTPFVPSSGNLNPTPPSIPPTGSISTSGDYQSVTTLVDLSMAKADIEEYIEAVKIIYGDVRYAIISEIALVAGCDKILTAGGLTYNEVVEAQVTAHITDYHSLRYTNNGLVLTADVGAIEPLLEVVAGP